MAAPVFAPGLLFISTPEGTQCAEQLVGKSYCSIADGKNAVVAVCSDGAYSVEEDIGVQSLCAMKLKMVAAGTSFHVAVDVDSGLYSWGANCATGQLGQGACHQSVQLPSRIIHSATFTSVACGEAFAVALDDKGGAHAWGENFDRQLGLYTKTKSLMHLANAVIEDLCFVPRLIPLSLANPVTKVACGSKFALVITKGGVLYSWGAGECGQLGTGRCTRREVPAPVMLIDGAQAAAEGGPASITMPLIVRDVACGAAHVVAADEQGALYCWGLNKAGQLGLDTTRTQHFPVAAKVLLGSVPDPECTDGTSAKVLADVVVAKVFANAHSSAAIDAEGRLFTWGSTTHHRLMHTLPLQPQALAEQRALSYSELRTQRMACAKGYVGHFKAAKAQALREAKESKAALRQAIPSIGRPTLVQTAELQDCIVQSFAFASTHSAALVLTCLRQASPAEGPRRSFSKLLLHGNGFWASPNIIVKFTFLRGGPGSKGPASRPATSSSRLPAAAPSNPPRSCSGSYVDSGTLQCKPPKFSESGVYAVSVSMDGSTFLPDTVEVFVHPELAVQKQLPELCDVSAANTINDIELHVTGLPVMPPDWHGCYSVRLQFTCLEGQLGPSAAQAQSATSSAMYGAGTSTRTAATSASRGAAVPADDFHITVAARLLPRSPQLPRSPSGPPTRSSTPSVGSYHDVEGEDGGAAHGAAAPAPQESTSVLLCDEVDLSEFKRQAGNSLYEVRCQVSLNGPRLLPRSPSGPPTRSSTPSVGSYHDVEGEDGGAAHGAAAPAPQESTSVLLCDEVDLSEFKRQAGNSLYEVRCQVSLNGQDFSSLKPARATHQRLRQGAHSPEPGGAEEHSANLPPLTLLYSFRPTSIEPSCAAIDRFWAAPPTHEGEEGEEGAHELPGMELTVRGSSFLPGSRLPKGAHVEATLMPALDGVQWQGGFAPQWADPGSVAALLPTIRCPVRCDQTACLTLAISGDGAAALHAALHLINAAAAGHDVSAGEVPEGAEQRVDALSLAVTFALVAPEFTLPLTSAGEPVVLTLFRPKRTELVPSCCGASATAPQLYSLLVHRPATEVDRHLGVHGAAVADGFPFFSAEAVVAVHVPAPGHGADPSGHFLPAVVLQKDAVKFLRLPPPSVPVPSEQTEAESVVPGPELFILQIELPPPSHWADVVGHEAEGHGEGGHQHSVSPHVFVSCWMDGQSPPPAETWAKLSFLGDMAHDCAISPPPPKTGFVAGNTVSADLTVHCPLPAAVHPAVLASCAGEGAQGEGEEGPELRPVIPQQCMVRVRGAPTDEHAEGASVCVAGRLADSAVVPGTSSISFEVPEGVPGLVPVQKTPKDKALYFVDISMDGGLTFSVAHAPLLHLNK